MDANPGKQPRDGIFRGFTVKKSECLFQALVIDGCLPDMVPALLHTCRAAAEKNPFRFPSAGHDQVIPEERDGHEGD